MRHSAPLQALPEGLSFPDDLADRIGYDERLRALTFDGPMYKGEFDRLTALSGDWSYRRAVEELFRQCVLADARPAGSSGTGAGGGPWRVVAALTLLAAFCALAWNYVRQRDEASWPRPIAIKAVSDGDTDEVANLDD